MENYNLCIATATIHFSDVYWCERSTSYCFDIKFENASTLLLDHLAFLHAGFDEDWATDFLNAVKQHFEMAGIFDGSSVSVLFSEGHALAIGTRGNDLWLDVRKGVCNNIPPLCFASLRLNIKNLTVY